MVKLYLFLAIYSLYHKVNSEKFESVSIDFEIQLDSWKYTSYTNPLFLSAFLYPLLLLDMQMSGDTENKGSFPIIFSSSIFTISTLSD